MTSSWNKREMLITMSIAPSVLVEYRREAALVVAIGAGGE